jgi:hypothetical protein
MTDQIQNTLKDSFAAFVQMPRLTYDEERCEWLVLDIKGEPIADALGAKYYVTRAAAAKRLDEYKEELEKAMDKAVAKTVTLPLQWRVYDLYAGESALLGSIWQENGAWYYCLKHDLPTTRVGYPTEQAVRDALEAAVTGEQPPEPQRETVAKAICAATSLEFPYCVCARDGRRPVDAVPGCRVALRKADAALSAIPSSETDDAEDAAMFRWLLKHYTGTHATVSGVLPFRTNIQWFARHVEGQSVRDVIKASMTHKDGR